MSLMDEFPGGSVKEPKYEPSEILMFSGFEEINCLTFDPVREVERSNKKIQDLENRVRVLEGEENDG